MDFQSMQQDGRAVRVAVADRVIFSGYNDVCYPAGLLRHLACAGRLIKDFAAYGQELTAVLKERVAQIAKRSRRAVQYVTPGARKEDIVKAAADEHGNRPGLVTILAATEPFWGFRLASGVGKPTLVKSQRRCLTYYLYVVHPLLGLIYLRVPTWLPFSLQVYFNGHNWLARQMRKHRIPYVQKDNAFVHVGDAERAQSLADTLPKLDWPSILDGIARPVMGPVQDILEPVGDYRWCVDQMEYSADHIFRDAAALASMRDDLLRHAISSGSRDILAFQGKRQVLTSDVHAHLGAPFEGLRVRHAVGPNSTKVYVKGANVLRLEVTINDITRYRELRRIGRRRCKIMRMRKSVDALPSTYRKAQTIAERYETYLSGTSENAPARRKLLRLGSRITRDGRSHRGISPSNEQDLALLRAVSHGEHSLHGFRNADIRKLLFGDAPDRTVAKRQAARVGRLLDLLRAHGLIARIQRSHRWRLTKDGAKLIAALLRVVDTAFPAALARPAA